jgi:2-keto-4-pentenoate hydratase/2-oxohepta-3-ene-1,7-dioic acid hydratase in catechol pathway
MPFDVDGTGREITPPMIFAVGLNYVAHAKELNKPIPEQPIVFGKSPNTLTASGSPIILPPEEPSVDYEGELAVILGPEPCRSVHRDDALKYATLPSIM